jgi:hypothetical protein
VKKANSHVGAGRFRRASHLSHTQLIAFILWSTLWLGCASHNVNPPIAQSHTGYVDIFDPEGRTFSWEIKDVRQQRPLYTEYKPQSGIVRLPLPPGSYELSIRILNTAISEPATVHVQVRDGQLTPVKVRLSEEGTSQIERKHTQLPGHYTRRTKITADETQSFRLEADVLPLVPYRTKEQAPYALNR